MPRPPSSTPAQSVLPSRPEIARAHEQTALEKKISRSALKRAVGKDTLIAPSGGNAIGPEGISLGKGVTLSAVTLVEDGAVSPSNAALTARIEDYTS